MIYAATGHRPERLGGHDAITWAKLCGFAAITLRRINPDKMVLGMALGWDMALACACVSLNVPFIAAIPFRGQERIWPKDKQKLYRMLVQQAEEFHVLSGGRYEPWKMFKRDKWVVTHSDKVLALWDGVPGGGTHGTIQYAEHRGVEVINVWDEWRQHCGL